MPPSRGEVSPGLLYDVAPLLALIGVYWLFAVTSHLNIGHRHLLPTYPAMFILAARRPGGFGAPPRRMANRRSHLNGRRRHGLGCDAIASCRYVGGIGG